VNFVIVVYLWLLFVAVVFLLQQVQAPDPT